MKKVISKIINLILVAIIVFAAGVMIMSGINAKTGKATTVLGYGFMAVQTGSMTPEYPVGSVIIIKKTDPDKLKVKDVISFYSSDPTLNNIVVTHRIMKINDDGDGTYSFTTMGDANVLEDEYPAESEKVIGKVIGKSSLMEKLVNVRENPTTFLLVVLLPMCLIIALEVFSIGKRASSNKETKNDENKE